MARLYSNENFPLPAVEQLRLLGHDVLTTRESGMAERRISDEDVLAYAVKENRAVLTINRRHFVRLHKERPTHRGIVVCSLDNDFAALARRIHAALAESPNMDGILLRINRPAPSATQ